jgi:RNA polymerase sigma factor (sigma-70 family)
MAGAELDRAVVEELVRAAAQGDQRAFDQLVARYAGLVWSVVRAHRLGDADAQDVFQTTWLRLVEHLHRLREPRAVGGWLATTARHESLRVLRQADRTRPAPEEVLDRADDGADGVDGVDGAETRVMEAERDRELWAAFAELEDRCRRLLRVLLADPPPAYDEVSAALDMPIGSIGPTRGRCLAHLRAHLRTRGISA